MKILTLDNVSTLDISWGNQPYRAVLHVTTDEQRGSNIEFEFTTSRTGSRLCSFTLTQEQACKLFAFTGAMVLPRLEQ